MAKSSKVLTPLVADSLATKALERIEAAIMQGEMGPGTRISEVELARRFGISRGPLREAIGRLEGRKLVQRTPNLGARIVSLGVEDLLELYQVREVLEGMAARLCAENITDEDLTTLKAMLDEHGRDARVKGGSAYFQKTGDQDFHFMVARCSRNTRLISLLCEDLYFLIRLYRARYSTKPGRAQRALKEHRQILKALKSHDSDAAEAAMRQHVRNSRDNMMTIAGRADEAAQ